MTRAQESVQPVCTVNTTSGVVSRSGGKPSKGVDKSITWRGMLASIALATIGMIRTVGTVGGMGTTGTIGAMGAIGALGVMWCPFGAHAGQLASRAAEAAQRNSAEYFELLRIPNVAAVPADIVRNAEFLQRAFERRGFRARLMQNAAGRPVVLAELRVGAVDAGPVEAGAIEAGDVEAGDVEAGDVEAGDVEAVDVEAGAIDAAALAADGRDLPTVLFYMHYDGQPVVAREWSQADPFEPVVRRRDAQGRWQDTNGAALQARPLDPELRVFARSAADDKAPIAMFLTAVDLLAERRSAPAYDDQVLLDGEEEIGSPSLAETIAADPQAFRADALVILDGPVHASGRPTLVFGNRGIVQTTLEVFGPRAPLHSGHFGNYVPNPAQRLAALLASMKDDDGRVTIAGYYDGVRLTATDRAALAAVDDDEAALLRRAGVARAERVGTNYQEALQYPSLNVRGMAAGGVGESAANVVPSEAIAEIDIRTTPETDGRRLFELVRRHIERQGYHLVEGEPTDEERTRFDKLARFTLHSVQAAARMPMDSEIARWAVRALGAPTAPTPREAPVLIRMMGGTVPTDVLVDALHMPFVLVPTVNPDNNQHARDENLRIGQLVTGTETIYSLLTTRFERPAPDGGAR
jgi:acetylornithine deacetylase/succinyl-diaminopimelate desuccinylase-like protein